MAGAPDIRCLSLGCVLSGETLPLAKPPGADRTCHGDVIPGITSIAGPGLSLPLLPFLGGGAHALDGALNLPRRNGNAAGLLQMPLGFQVGRLIGSFQAHELGQGRRISPLQTQRGVHRIMACLLARMVIIIPLQLGAAKEALHRQVFPALANLPRLGLISSIRTIHGGVERFKFVVRRSPPGTVAPLPVAAVPRRVQ